MKTPSVEEVKEYFKNAKTVRCLVDGKVYFINLKKEMNQSSESLTLFFQKNLKGKNDDCVIWHKDVGYAQIVSYSSEYLEALEKRVAVLENKVDLKKIADMPKNPIKLNFGIDFGKVDSHSDVLSERIRINQTFGIPMDMIRTGTKGFPISSFHKDFIKNMEKSFSSIDTDPNKEVNKLKLRIEELETENKAILAGPNAAAISFTASSTFDFKDTPMAGTNVKEKTVLQVGKWYIKIGGYCDGLLFCFQGKYSTDRDSGSFGFSADRLWNDNIGVSKEDEYREATESEVFKSLKNEAVKRGFVKPVHVKGIYVGISNKNLENIFKDFRDYDFKNNELWYYGDPCSGVIFKNGKWAEIISTITKEEAEKELGKKIV